MSITKWKEIANEKQEIEDQVKKINNEIFKTKLKDKLGQVEFNKMFKPRLDTQIDMAKKIEDNFDK